MAWLNATPERTKDEPPDAKQYSRLESMRRVWRPDWIDLPETTQEYYEERAALYMPELPPIECGGDYMIHRLYEVGPTGSNGMGAVPVTWTEIDAWCRRGGVDLSPSEARLLRRLSVEYVSMSHKATENFHAPPWWPEGEIAEQQAAEGIPRPLTKEEVASERQMRM